MSYFDQLMKQAKVNDAKKLSGFAAGRSGQTSLAGTTGRSSGSTGSLGSLGTGITGGAGQVSDNFSLLMKQARKNDNRRIAGTKYGYGNIDLTSRPTYRNEDGSISTVSSASYNIDGKEVLLPTVWVRDGKAYRSEDDDEIVQRYRDTGEYLGKFDTPEAASEYAQALHEAQEQQYAAEEKQKAPKSETTAPTVSSAAKRQQLEELKAQLAAEKAKAAPARTTTNSRGREITRMNGRAQRLGGDPAKCRELEKQIRAVEQELQTAEQTEKANEFYSVWQDPDFQQTAKKGGAKKGNVVVNSRAHKNPQGHRGRAGKDSHFVDVAYSNMSDDEVNTYNYLYETDEKKAKEYLDFIREDLNRRQGEKEGKIVRENTDAYGRVAGTLAYGAGAGLDQFGSGVAQFVSPERRDTSATQFGSAYIREDLKDTGPALPDWLGGASLGQAAYDAVTTTANMAPSVLLSALTAGAGAPAAAAQAVGTTALGVGAAGNAYGQALAEGRDKTEARLYSTLIGASEAGLQSLLGGIGALGGSMAHLPKVSTFINNIDNSLARISANLGMKMLSEGGEEYIQEILDPAFRNMVYGEKNSVDLWTPEATYSFLLGALTAGLLDGAGSVRSDIQINRDGAKIKGAQYDGKLIDAALQLDPETEAYSTAKQIRSGKLKNSTHNIGELFYQYARAEGNMGIFDAPVETEAGKAETQSAGRLDPVTTALLSIDMGNGQHMNLKTAEQKAAIITRCAEGGVVDAADVRKLNLTQSSIRQVFEEFVGAKLPDDFNKLSATEQAAAVQNTARAAREGTAPATEIGLPAMQAASKGNFTSAAATPMQAAQEAVRAPAEATENAAPKTEAASIPAPPAQDAGPSGHPMPGPSGQSLGQVATREDSNIPYKAEELVRNHGKKYIEKHGENAYAAAVIAAVENGDVKADAVGELYVPRAEDHIDNRDRSDVGSREVKAFQFQNPEIHPYYAKVAGVLLDELGAVQRGGELVRLGSYRDIGGEEYTRLRRSASEAISELRDDYGLSYADIEKALNAIVEDKGQDNIAVAKRMELKIDELLENDYHSAWGDLSEFIDLDAYRAAKAAIRGAQPQESRPVYDAGSFEAYRAENQLALESGDVTEDDLRAEWERKKRETSAPHSDTAEQTQSTPISYEEFAALARENEPSASDEVVRQFYAQYLAEANGEGATITLDGVDHSMTYDEFEAFTQALSESLGQPRPDDVSLREMFDEKRAEQNVDTEMQTSYNEEENRNGREGNESSRAEPERADSLAAEESGGGVPGGAEAARAGEGTQRRRAKDLRDRVRNAGNSAPEQSAREVGVQGGTERKTLRVVPEDLYTDEMREVRDAYEAQGVDIVYFTGYLNIADGEGGSFNARAAVSTDGEKMWLKADHDTISVRQLAKHEEFHRIVQEDGGLLSSTVSDIVAEHGQELGKMVSRYIAQYGWTDRSNESILEEICADAYAGIDIFNLADPMGRGAEVFSDTVEKTAERTNGFRRRLGKEARNAVRRMRRGEKLSFEELIAIPEVAAARQRELRGGAQTADLPNREAIQARAKEAALARGSYSGEDANGKAQYSGPVKQGRRIDIVIGLPGSGKSSVYSDGLSAEHQARISDVDDIRPSIPEYDDTNAWQVHKESKAVADAALKEMLRRGDNIVLSILGDNPEVLRKRIIEYTDKHDYDVYLHLNEVANATAVQRAVYRYLTEGRWVDLGMIHDFGDKPTQSYLELTGQKGAGNEADSRPIDGATEGGRDPAGVRQTDRQQGATDVPRGRGRDGKDTPRAVQEGRRGAPSKHRAAGADTGAGEAVQLLSASGDGSKEAVRLAGFDRYNNDVNRGEPPRLDRATSSVLDTYERAKRAKDNVKNGIKFSTETTDAEYASTLDAVVSLMDEYGLYVPSAIRDAVNGKAGSAELTTALDASSQLVNAIAGTDSYDVFEALWDDEKQELNDLIDKLSELEKKAAETKQANYQNAVEELIAFMEEHGMTVPEEVKANLATATPKQMLSVALDPSIGTSVNADVYYLNLTDVEDDALQALLDKVASYEANPTDQTGKGLEYEEDLEPSESWASPEELASMFAMIQETVDEGTYAPEESVSAKELQTDREGFTPTDTPEFKAWFHDDSGKLTLPDGEPRVLLSGGKRMGRTSINFDIDTKSSPGLWATGEPRIANLYAGGGTSHIYHSLMDAVYGGNQPRREVKLRNAKSWQDAIDYVADYWQRNGNGLRVVGVDADGNITDDASKVEYYSLQSNLLSQMEYVKFGAFAEGEYRDIAGFPATEEGLRSFNRYIGEAIDTLDAGVSGWIKVYGSAQHTLVVNADYCGYDAVPTQNLPAELLEGGIPRRGESHTQSPDYVHVNDLVRHAFKNGYDAVILENIEDAGGVQTQYAFRDSSQIKSVYNSGDWSAKDNNFKFSQENRQSVDDFIRRFNEEHGEGAAEQLYQTVQELRRAKARAERKLKAEQESRQAERSLSEQARRDDAAAWLIYHKKMLRTVQREYRARLDEAHRAKAEAVKNAVAEATALERASADVRVEQQKAKDAQKLESTVLAERMNAKKQAAKRLRVKEDTYTNEKAERRDNEKLRRNAAKNLLRDNRRVAERRAVIETTQGPVDTIRKSPKDRIALERVQGAADALRTLGRSGYRAFVNQAHDIDRFAKRQKSGTLASTLVNIVGGASTTTETIYKQGLVDRSGNRIGESMSDVFLCRDARGKKVDESKQALLQDYMLHKHNIDRMSFVANARTALEAYESAEPWLAQMDARELAKLTAMTDAEAKKLGKQEAREKAQQYAKLLNDYSEARDKPVFPDANGNAITAETSREVVAKYETENPWLTEKAEGIYQWWDLFMRTWVVGDSLSEAHYDTMRAMYPHYVPTYRADKKALGAGNFVGMGGASAGSVVKKAKGGLSEIVNIEDSFANLANKAIRVARTNELYKNMIDTAMLDSEGLFSDMAVFDWESTRLGHAYYAADGTEVRLDTGAERTAEAADALERAEQAGLVKTKDGYRLSAWYDGELLSSFVSEDLFKSIQNTTGSAANDLEKGLLKVGNALTGPMKTAITGINPNFAMRNISRDLPTAVVNSISGMAFPKYWKQAAQEMHAKSERWMQYQALGGTHATYYNDQQGFARAMSQGDGLGAQIVGKVGWFNEVTEAQTRFAEYLATIDRLGDTYENRLLGIKNSAEVTVDFSRKGRYGKVINAWVPYWNPAVQGIDKVFRSVVDSPDGSTVWKQATRTLGRAAMVTVLFEALQYAMLKMLDDYDEWEQLSDRVKDTYYCIPTGEHKFLRIPKSREWGAILGTPLMRLLESANGRDDPFENYVETSLAPNFLPGTILGVSDGRIESDVIGVSQALDLAYNEDFAGRTIVPYAYQQGTATEQYDAETSMFSRKLGELLHFSPMQLDYIIEDYFGDFGDLFTMATAEATWSGDRTASDISESVKDIFVQPWITDNRYSNQTVSDYYETVSALEKRVQDRRNQLGDAAKDTVEYKTQKALEKLYGTEIKEISRSLRDMPDGTEKDEGKERIAELSAQALDFYKQAMDGGIAEPELTAEYAELPSSLSDELIRMKGLSTEYSFTPSNYTPSKYSDPRKSGYEYLLDDEQKEKYRELYHENYAEIMLSTMDKDRYRKASDTKKAEMLEDARDRVTEETKDAFLDWLHDNYRSTKKSK